MSEFVRYQRVVKYGNMEVDGIEIGKVYIFPKLDGTNSSVWIDDGIIKAGSRNRELSLDNDNQGFYEYVLSDAGTSIRKFLYNNPDYRLYGEWLVPHTLKTYDESAWRKFYVFDVTNDSGYINYDKYKPMLDEYGIDYIPAICTIENGTKDRIGHQLENSNYLVKDGEGLGEGIVVKNYEFVNKFGRIAWAKIIRADFKAKHSKEMEYPEISLGGTTEKKIADSFVTSHLVDKTVSKIMNENNGWSSKFIPRLFMTVFYDLVNEDMWDIIKKYKNPTIDFSVLYNFTVHKVKDIREDLFA